MLKLAQTHAWRHMAAALALATAGCGGGGGTVGGGGTAVVNTPPSFTSAATAGVAENTTGTIYAAAATDAQGSAVTYSISGGVDAAKFMLLADGALSFVTAPNFDLAGDADGDNVYQVILSASDGQLSSTQNLAVTVTNSKEGVQVRRITTGFTNPAAVSVITGSNAIYVGEKGGGLYELNPSTGAKVLLTTIPVATDGDRGIAAVYASLDHPSMGYIYVLYSAPNGDVKFTRYRRNFSNDITVPSLIDVVLSSHAANNDYGGWIGSFDQYTVYVATGDGGGIGDPTGSAQNANSRLGKLLRVAINPDPFAGAAPEPFATFSTIATGLHNPSGGDLVTGGIYLTDRGESARDEIDLFPFPAPTAGYGNYGWPFREGTQTVRSGGPSGLVDPVAEYARGTGNRMGQAITGGVNYRGSVTSLIGAYLFIDRSGKVFAIPANSLVAGSTQPSSRFEDRTLDFVPDVGTIDRPVAMTEDAAGNIYIVDDDGEVFMLRANGS